MYSQAFILAHFSAAALRQRLSFFTFCLNNYLPRCSQGGHESKIFWILGFYIAGKFISDTLSDCRGTAARRLSAAAAIFVGTIEFHTEFYEIGFYNSI